MLLLNKREERMAVSGGGGNLRLKTILVAYVLKNTEKLVVNRGRTPGI